MRFKDLTKIYYSLKYNTPQKRAFINKLEYLPPQRARQILNPKYYKPYFEDPLFKEGEKLGVSKALIKEIARWILQEDFWKEFNIKRLP